MKVVLICPSANPALTPLAGSTPLVKLPILGKTLLEHWLEHVAKLGAKEVCLLTADRPEEIQDLVGDGARWGMRVEVRPEMQEQSAAEAILMDHFPGRPGQPLLTSYADWYELMLSMLNRGEVPQLIGLREVQPGIWVGRRTRLAPDAKLHAPCWIGENVWIGAKAIIGPGAVIEHRALISAGAEIRHSVVAPETYVGEQTLVNQSIALGHLLINWKTNSCLRVPDPFLLCGLREQHPLFEEVTWPSQLASLLVLGLSLPFGALSLLKAKLQEVPGFRRLVVRGRGLKDGKEGGRVKGVAGRG